MGGRCAVAVAAALWLGLILGGALEASGTHRGTAPVWLAGAAALAMLAERSPPRLATVALLAAVGLGGIARGALRADVFERRCASVPSDAVPRWLTVRVAGHPAREARDPTAIVEVADPRAGRLRGLVVRLRLPPGCTAEWGDRLEVLVQLDPLPARRNPGGYSARESGESAGIAAQGRALAARPVHARGWPRATVTRWRRAVEGSLRAHLDSSARELVAPLLIGDRSGLSPELGAEFRASGLTHLLALSGMHVTWLAGIAGAIAAASGAGPRGRAAGAAACALFYVGIAGPVPSLVRAALTEWMRCGARIAGRALDPVQALAVSAIGALVTAPAWAGDLGFQLSCAATLGLVTIGRWLAERGEARSRIARGAIAALAPTIAAQVAALPLLVARFNTLPWTGLLSNLVAVPVSGLLLASAWLGVALECVAPGAGRPWLLACEPLAHALRVIAGVSSRLPAASFATGAEPSVAWLAGAGAVLLSLSLAPIGVATPPPRDRHRRIVAARGLGGLCVALALVMAATAKPLRPPPGRWWMVVLDVGQGDAIALGFEDGWWLVDAGPRSPRYDAGQSVVAPFFRWAGVRRLEVMALTHDDGDHTGGAAAVARALRVGRVLAPVALPGVAGPSARFAAVAAGRGDTVRRRPRGIVRWPPRGAALRADNAASLVLEIGEPAARALLAADVDSTVEESLAVAGPFAVLKVAHHGSGSSSGSRFLAQAGARHAVISSGRRNPHGHPHPLAIARLVAAGAAVHRTDRLGAVWIELSTDGARLIDWRRGPPSRDPPAGVVARSPSR
jgi:competence protein ComEC